MYVYGVHLGRSSLAAPPLALAALLFARTSSADVCPAPTYAPEVATIDSAVRLAYLDRAFAREVHDVDLWSWTWGSVYTAGAVGEGVLLALNHDPGKKIDLEVGIGSTAFGAVSLYGLPFQLTVPLRLARGAMHGGGDPCVALARAERTLRSVEKDQVFANGPVGHLGNIAVNIGFTLLLGLGYGRWSSGAISSAVGIPLGEANAFTQPHHLTEVLARYRAGQLDFHGTPGPRIAWSVAPLVGTRAAGATVGLAW